MPTRNNPLSDILEIIRADITTLDTDAIVNAANVQLRPGGGVCGAIHSAAGPELALACQPLAPCPAGEARLTPGFDLCARYVIHTVGPVWQGGTNNEAALLAACYRNSIALAQTHNLKSIAFPAISTGIFGYPEDQAARITISTLADMVGRFDEMPQIYLCCFSSSMQRYLEEALHKMLKGAN